ncbi:MAG TPA: DUF883 family protein [Opitutaceae bacterium]|nr:DUF883 family protein [Opitutaceae bacterium]
MNANTNEKTPAEMVEDLRTIIAEAEKMIADSAAAGVDEASAALRQRLESARERLSALYEDAREKVAAGARYTDTAIRENPYQSMAVALGLGLVAGILLGRRCHD